MEEKFLDAMALFYEGERAQAYKLLAEIVKQDPNNSRAWYGLALCLHETKKKDFLLAKSAKYRSIKS
jgi:Tfp pilus assembly protein PilF